MYIANYLCNSMLEFQRGVTQIISYAKNHGFQLKSADLDVRIPTLRSADLHIRCYAPSSISKISSELLLCSGWGPKKICQYLP